MRDVFLGVEIMNPIMGSKGTPPKCKGLIKGFLRTRPLWEFKALLRDY